jgi:hypothetical protein
MQISHGGSRPDHVVALGGHRHQQASDGRSWFGRTAARRPLGVAVAVPWHWLKNRSPHRACRTREPGCGWTERPTRDKGEPHRPHHRHQMDRPLRVRELQREEAPRPNPGRGLATVEDDIPKGATSSTKANSAPPKPSATSMDTPSPPTTTTASTNRGTRTLTRATGPRSNSPPAAASKPSETSTATASGCSPSILGTTRPCISARTPSWDIGKCVTRTRPVPDVRHNGRRSVSVRRMAVTAYQPLAAADEHRLEFDDIALHPTGNRGDVAQLPTARRTRSPHRRRCRR